MKVFIYVVIVALSLCAPVKRLDIAKLLPIEAVAVCSTEAQVLLITDTGHTGRGETVQQALTDLKNRTPAVVYLDTAEYLLVGNGAEEEARQLLSYMKNTVKVGLYRGGDVQEEARYLDVHGEAAKPQ